MQRHRKEACRNFQRGFCQYGERCKFLHQQPQPQQIPQSSNNPFGFGGNKPQQPFDNKWSRFSPVSNNPAAPPSLRQQQQQPSSKSQPATNHECTDPESCKRVIAEDFQNERPFWKLTCYGHWKSLPCDVSGDISCEELRAAAYDDAKRGLGLPAIVERERSLINSKLLDFDNLLRDHGKPGHGTSITSHAAPGSTPPTVSSFSQLGASLNLGVGLGTATPQPNPFSIANQMATASAIKPSTPISNPFARSSPFANPGSLSSHIPQQPIMSSPATSFGSIFNSGAGSQAPPSAGFAQNLTPVAGLGRSLHQSAVQAPAVTNGSGLAPASIGQASPSVQSVGMTREDDTPADASVWQKQKWAVGEIPEQAPPEMYIY